MTKKLTKRQLANYTRGYDDGFSHIDKWGVPALYEGRVDIRNLYGYGYYRRGFVDGWNDTLEVMRLD